MQPSSPRSRNLLLTVLVSLVAAPAWAQAAQGATANWTGAIRCEIRAEAPGYSHQETQTWTLTGGAPTPQGAMQVYPAVWTVSGQGSHDRTRYANRRVAQWTAAVPGPNAPVSAPVAFSAAAVTGEVIAQLWHGQLTRQGGYTGTDQYINDGVPAAPLRLVATTYEWQFPKMIAEPKATRLSGSNTFEVKAQVGPLQPAEAQAIVSCAWELARGTANPLPPSTTSTNPPGSATPTNPGSTTSNTNPPANPAGSTTSTGTPGSTTPTTPGTTPGTNPPGSTTPGGTTSPPTTTARLLSVTPASFEQGALGTIVTLAGTSTHWQQGPPTVTVEPGIGVPITNAQAQSDTSLLAQLDIQYSAAPGPRTVTVRAGNEVVTLPNAFTITPRARPVLTSVAPNTGKPGDQNVTVTLTGRDTRWATGKTTVTIGLPFDASNPNAQIPPQYVTVQSLTINSATSATAVVNVAANAPAGPYWVSVWDPTPSDWLKIVDGFTVTTAPGSTGTPPGGSAPTSRLTLKTPNGGEQWVQRETDIRDMVWTHSYPAGTLFDVQISVDGGTHWTQIASTSGSYMNIQPFSHADLTPTTSALVRVSPVGKPAEGDMSDAPFTILPSPTAIGFAPAASPEQAQRYTFRFANMIPGPPHVTTIDAPATSPGTTQWWKINAFDDPVASTTPMLQFVASISGGPADRTYQIDLVEETSEGRVTRSISPNVHAPTSSVRWSNVPGSDDSKTLYVAVRWVSGAPSTEKYTLRLQWGGLALP